MLPSIPFAPFDVSEVYRRLNERSLESERRRIERRGLKEMLSLDDHALRDIGLTRGDVEHVSRLPGDKDRSSILWRLSARNKARG
jgi:uncharacterized protein YjiS (DUF1127 family)